MKWFGALVIALLAAGTGGFIEAGYIPAPSAAQAAAAAHVFYVGGSSSRSSSQGQERSTVIEARPGGTAMRMGGHVALAAHDRMTDA